MYYSSEDEIKDLVSRFEDGTLEHSEWTHAAHLTVGMHYCLAHPFGVAKNLMSDGIHWLNDRHGTPNNETSGYHETLTVFWLRRISDFLNDNRDEADMAKLANLLIGHLSDRSLPLRIYSRELLFSKDARLRLVEPDLINVRPANGTFELSPEAI